MESLSNYQDAVAEFAGQNINILSINNTEDTQYICYEFQWRDPRNNAMRWSKTLYSIERSNGIATCDWSAQAILQHIEDDIRKVRGVLENGENYK